MHPDGLYPSAWHHHTVLCDRSVTCFVPHAVDRLTVLPVDSAGQLVGRSVGRSISHSLTSVCELKWS